MYWLNFTSSSKIPYIIIPRRQEHLDDEEEYKAEILEELEEEGVDTTFRETTGFYRANSVQQNYTEALFGDDGYEKTKRALLKRVADETRSFPVIDVDYYMYREAASLARNEELAKKFKETAAARGILHPNAPFSLAKSQLAFWTIIILSSFIYAWLSDPADIPELNKVNLILLGISVATMAAGKVIDDSQKNNGDLSQDNPSDGFIKDILSDKEGVSIHRLQNVLWTVIVGIIYIHYVATNRSLPDDTVLTDNLLILMGISTGAYIGLKTAENTKPAEVQVKNATD